MDFMSCIYGVFFQKKFQRIQNDCGLWPTVSVTHFNRVGSAGPAKLHKNYFLCTFQFFIRYSKFEMIIFGGLN